MFAVTIIKQQVRLYTGVNFNVQEGAKYTNDNTVTRLVREHTCSLPNTAQTTVENALCKMRKRARESSDTPQELIQSITVNQEDEVIAKFPKYTTMQRNIEKIRKRINNPHATPRTLAHT